MEFIKIITSILLTPAIAIMSLAGYKAVPNEIQTGAFAPTGGETYRLRNSIASNATSITLSSFKEPVSNIPYTMSYLGSEIGYGTINPGVPGRSEFISFTGITQHASGTAMLTGVTRGLTRTPGGGYCTASTTLAMAHAGQSTFILSDSPCLFAEYAVKRNDETITGQWTFNSFPITPQNSTSTESLTGIVELATALEGASSTPTGTGPLVLQAKNATSTYNSATAALKVVVTQNDGKIDPNFISTSVVPPPGSIIAYSTTTAPTGWLLADGSAVSRTTYANLYAVIGTSYGVGDGSTTFNLPDLRGRTIVMASSTQTATSSNNRANLGATGGATTHTQTVNELAPHTHTVDAIGSADNNFFGSGASAAIGTNGATAASAGGGVAFNILDPYIVLNYLIKY